MKRPSLRRTKPAITPDNYLRPVPEAVASLPLPSPTIPDPAEVEHDAAARIEVLAAAAALDEFTPHTLDTYYDHVLIESRATLLLEANSRRHVDSVLVDSHRTRLAAAQRAAARRAATAAERSADAAVLRTAHDPLADDRWTTTELDLPR